MTKSDCSESTCLTGDSWLSGSPSHALPVLPVTLDMGLLSFTADVSSRVRDEAVESFRAFLSTAEMAGINPGKDQVSSVLELVSRYLDFKDAQPADSSIRGLSVKREILGCVLNALETTVLCGHEIHTKALQVTGDRHRRRGILKSYYQCKAFVGLLDQTRPSMLFRSVDAGRVKLYSIFGGQGIAKDYFAELRELYSTYAPFVGPFILNSAELLRSLSSNSQVSELFSDGLDVARWLHFPESTPSSDYLISSPISFPLIGLLQLSNYAAICMVSGEGPRGVLQRMSGTTGHSQGIVTAVVAASADSWERFNELTKSALTILFWIGSRSQQAHPQTVLSPSIIRDSVDHDEGNPTPMLSIRGLSRELVESHIEATNKYLTDDRQVAVALVNNFRNFVIAGPPLSLYALNVRLRRIKCTAGEDPSRVAASKRKPVFTNEFLPITSPFHSKYLNLARDIICNDLQDIKIPSHTVRIPLYNTHTGQDISSSNASDIIPALVRMITTDTVTWPIASKFLGATHILDFGPCGRSGVGVMTYGNKEGSGIRVLLACAIDGTNTEVGYRPEVLSWNTSVIHGPNWAKEHGPRLLRRRDGHIFLDTKLSRLLGVPPLVVGGMTPTTTHWDVVAATMKAGYHIELAGGGYHNARDMREALMKLARAITPGRGITVNLIYLSPQAMAWQVPLLAKLRSEGVPIEGLTIGGGVPSVEVVRGFIDTIQLKHIGFKPGSVEAIKQVVAIAKANPRFPIILQWTGGRAGGHHSFEDFHQPIYSMYGKIRACKNMILVAGSGFGGAEDTYPYLTGSWSSLHGTCSKMPFDGCLFGSRVLIAKETHTSPAAKLLIAETPGVGDAEWENAYAGPAGGVISVISEMGEPIHMLATRGAIFWAEMDRKIFGLPQHERVRELKTSSKYIIKRLNEDFQRVWFGINEAGQAVELVEMTYSEILRRLVNLFTFRGNLSLAQWIDPSYKDFTRDFIQRIEERFLKTDNENRIPTCYALEDPYKAVEEVITAHPATKDMLIVAQDADYFVDLCCRRGTKPVNFIPVLDENFERYFKKDSLWQSERLETVVDGDVGRIVILQGPCAVRHSKVVDEPIKAILDSVNSRHIELLMADEYENDPDKLPVVEYFGGEVPYEKSVPDLNSLTIIRGLEKTMYRISSAHGTKLPSPESWAKMLAGAERSWRHAFFLSPTFTRGNKLIANPFRSIFNPRPGLVVEFNSIESSSVTNIVFKHLLSDGDLDKVFEVRRVSRFEIVVSLDHICDERRVTLSLSFNYNPEAGYAPIFETVHSNRNNLNVFYWQTWFGDDDRIGFGQPATELFSGGSIIITKKAIKDFVSAIRSSSDSPICQLSSPAIAPLDFGIVVAWKVLTKPLFSSSIDADFSKLVHLSNEFKMMPDEQPLREGDDVQISSKITAIVNQESGKMVEVLANLERTGSLVMVIKSRFLFRGTYDDYEDTFQNTSEIPMKIRNISPADLALLRSKEWLTFNTQDDDLLGQTLVFRLDSFMKFKEGAVFLNLQTKGHVFLELPFKQYRPVGVVEFQASHHLRNPVNDFLQRHGAPGGERVSLKNPIGVGDTTTFKTPSSNAPYAHASMDFNPIHLSETFSAYAGLPGQITHGMYTSAVIRGIVEKWGVKSTGQLRSFSAKFQDMLLPNEEVLVKVVHSAMAQGRKVLVATATKKVTGETVLVAEAEIEQPVSAYLFTGQGSQHQGMGMELYETSEAARAVWDKADTYFLVNYGFSIIKIVQENPTELEIHFGGPRGKAIRQNYMSMSYESGDECLQKHKMFADINETTDSYTFRAANGLLNATQFTQPALALMEMARFNDMKALGLVQEGSSFAGHSLGEYPALASLGGIMSIEKLIGVSFFRGLTMQFSIKRDEMGQSGYSMLAVDPGRISPSFTQVLLGFLVSTVAEETGWLLEIVNYNISNRQYICAGEIKALMCLKSITDHFARNKTDIEMLPLKDDATASKIRLVSFIKEKVLEIENLPSPLILERGLATIPLSSVDVPFHSTYLRPGISAYRQFLLGNIDPASVNPEKLIGKWIPNITGRLFGISQAHLRDFYRMTNSSRIRDLLVAGAGGGGHSGGLGNVTNFGMEEV